MTRISYTVEKSCSKHKLLKPGTLPRGGHVSMTPRRIFALGSLILQDPSVNRRSVVQTQKLWRNLYGLYGVYLAFERSQIVASATGEHLTRISEIVGIACGLAALTREFVVPLNRVGRFLGRGGGRRLDFEFYVNGHRYFHEAKGTTYNGNTSTLKADIDDQADATAKLCAKAGHGPKLAGATGSIARIQHVSRKQFDSSVLIVDPPTTARGRASKRRELATLLRHYASILAVTHTRSQTDNPPDIVNWLEHVISELESNRRPPATSPARLLLKGRVTEKFRSEKFGGTYFDARSTPAAAAQFATFEEASAALRDPLSFYGVSNTVTEMIRSCSWEELLNYSHPKPTNTAKIVLESSGVLMMQARSTREFDGAAQSGFNAFKRAQRGPA
jgi:hypothetical protein